MSRKSLTGLCRSPLDSRRRWPFGRISPESFVNRIRTGTGCQVAWRLALTLAVFIGAIAWSVSPLTTKPAAAEGPTVVEAEVEYVKRYSKFLGLFNTWTYDYDRYRVRVLVDGIQGADGRVELRLLYKEAGRCHVSERLVGLSTAHDRLWIETTWARPHSFSGGQKYLYVSAADGRFENSFRTTTWTPIIFHIHGFPHEGAEDCSQYLP